MKAKVLAILTVLVRTFVVAALGAATAYGGSILVLGVTAGKGIAAAAVAAVIVAAYHLVTSYQGSDLPTDLILVFAATALGQLATIGVHVFDLGADQWKGVLAAAVAATLAAAFQWLNPGNAQYGVGEVVPLNISK